MMAMEAQWTGSAWDQSQSSWCAAEGTHFYADHGCAYTTAQDQSYQGWQGAEAAATYDQYYTQDTQTYSYGEMCNQEQYHYNSETYSSLEMQQSSGVHSVQPACVINLDCFTDDSGDEADCSADEAEPKCQKLCLPAVRPDLLSRDSSAEPAAEPSPLAKTLGEAMVPCEAIETETKEQQLSEPCSKALLDSESSACSEPECEVSSREDEAVEALANASRVLTVQELLRWRFLCTKPPAGVLTVLPAERTLDESPSPASGARAARASLPEFRSSKMVKQKSMPTPQPKLEASPTSWAATRKLDGGDANVAVVRTIKSILNKLTLEKFTALYEQLLECGISTVSHLELLIQEVFQKATTQHHFIQMYADLCAMLHSHFSETPLGDDPKFSFKKLLLNECQASFERHLQPPKELQTMDDPEERILAEVRYKTHMLGNIRFVGALLARKMLASKVLLAIMDELLTEPSPEALESAAALLTVVGPTIDTPDFMYRPALDAIFAKVKKLSHNNSVEQRARCLLKDVLDLKAAGWKDRKPKRMEGPMTLDKVAEKAAAESSQPLRRMAPKPAPAKAAAAKPSQERAFAPAARPKQAPVTAAPSPFNPELFREKAGSIFRALKAEGGEDPEHAVSQLLALQKPISSDAQSAEIVRLLSAVAEEGTPSVRRAGFRAIAGLFIAEEGRWRRGAAKASLQCFLAEVCGDLVVDVPNLPAILREEMAVAFQQLVEMEYLEADVVEELRNFQV